ncbi:limulus clotting factor C-like [Harpegnathos saltator]|uniref:limulus clotting factor C-like n=1 Tax=Harpegnathos saltator TaxID=610380 RepID=UPI000DBEED3B|nr:limulus clotting factor C-like [Harpegnathos saltator]
MKACAVLSTVLSLLALLPSSPAQDNECGKTTQDEKLIVNGNETKVDLFPWYVGIYQKNDDAKTYKHICSGTLISNNFVVSAAHCFYDETENKPYNASNYAVGAGKHYRSWDAQEQYSQKSLVEYIKLRRRYFGIRGNLAEDIALVKLQMPLDLNMLVRPICMDWQNMYDKEQLREGQLGKLVGWDKDITDKLTENLYKVTMPYVPYRKCRNDVPLEFRGLITFDKFCAGPMNGSSTCDGYNVSGSGLYFEKDGTWYLRGVASVSLQKKDHCDYTSYIAFTRINRYLKWINYFYVKM